MNGMKKLGNGRNGTDKLVGDKPKVVVIMGPTGSGKSRLAIDLASHIPVEIINADSMQVYQGLDVLTNKVSLHEQKGVPHHLLGTVSPNVEFTSKDFRDSAIPIINDILSRNCFPVIVGGTNYYIQALVSPFLLDDCADVIDGNCSSEPGMISTHTPDFRGDGLSCYESLKDIDPVAANRLHPNNHRKINQYLSLYHRSGVLPSNLFQGKAAESWGCADGSRYDCCFICVDASLPVLDQYVEQRVDCMVESGVLSEAYDIYKLNADYTRGLRQAIGVREFEDYFSSHLSKCGNAEGSNLIGLEALIKDTDGLQKNLSTCSGDNMILLKECIDKVKANTRRLVRRQKRRLTRLQTIFGWTMHYVNSTEALRGGNSGEYWASWVVEQTVKLIKKFLDENAHVRSDPPPIQRDLWTQYTCEGCANKVLRGTHEWEQHRKGRNHRKRISHLRKAHISLENLNDL